jgi:hypothetical protein
MSTSPEFENTLLSYAAPDRVMAQMHASDAEIRYSRGPRGSGKSSSNLMDLWAATTRMPPCLDGTRRARWLIARATYPSLERTVIKTVESWFGNMAVTRHTIPPVTNIKATDASGPIECEFVYMALPDKPSLQHLRSFELTGAFLNEVIELPLDVIGQVTGSIGRFPAARDFDPRLQRGKNGETVSPYRSFILADTNPADEDHIWRTDFEDDLPPNAQAFIQEGAYIELTEREAGIYFEHNPAMKALAIARFGHIYIPNPRATYARIVPGGFNYWARMIRAATNRGEISTLVCNKWAATVAGKPVWETFDTRVHVANTELQSVAGLRLEVGLDHSGLHPSAAIGQMVAGQLVVYDALYDPTSTGTTGFADFLDHGLLPTLAEFHPGAQVHITLDPAIARAQIDMRTVLDVLAERGLAANPAHTNAIRPRIETVARRLSRRGGLLVSAGPRTKPIRKALGGGYHYPETASGAHSAEPAKNAASHPADALQYLSLAYDMPYSRASGGSSTGAVSTRIAR